MLACLKFIVLQGLPAESLVLEVHGIKQTRNEMPQNAPSAGTSSP